MKTYIAVDIGASSGRLIKSQLIDGKIQMKEIHRFKNEFSLVDGHERWNADYLVKEILEGLSIIKQQGILDCYIGIDTWAVDYCLFDEMGNRIEQPIAYRDNRTANAILDFSKKLSLQTLYNKTGIQILPFNTIFQLYVESPQRLKKAKTLLLFPDYLNYVLTGKQVTEETNASTMQLLNVFTKFWDDDLLKLLGISSKIFPPIVEAGTVLGRLEKERFPDHDLPDAVVISIASHDTASAILGTPGIGQDWAYISSGTWSLLGVETKEPIISNEAYWANYTNEWGAFKKIRFLKNIMGMWLIQEVARIQNYQFSYEALAKMANQVKPFQQFIDVNDARFLNPLNMIDEIQSYCRETNQLVPESPAELARCVYDNLALCYACGIEELEQLTGKHLKRLHIVGGGSNNHLLNQLTADVTQMVVESGPSEATAIGNIVMQMITTGELENIEKARECIRHSFELFIHEPQKIESNILDKYRESIEIYHRKKVMK